MKIKSISFSNFKFVPKDKEFLLDLTNAESLILGGPNGYGKTTVFDAVELLVTGQIRHFNADLPNRGKESISVLANDISQDLCVAAEFTSSDGNFLIRRQFYSNNEFKSVLWMNGESIDDNRLFSLLGISKNLFELGIYISQIDSLNFLQQKYKTRKESIIGILDSSHIENRFEEFKKIQDLLKNKFDEEEKRNTTKLSEINSERSKLADALKALQLSQDDIPYTRLFENKEYSFDKEMFNQDETFDVVISPVDDLIEFCKYEKAFFLKKRNIEINEIISYDKKIYTSLFYAKEISECLAKSKTIDISNELVKIKDAYQKKNFYLNEIVITGLELDKEIVCQINDLLLQKITIEKGMTNTQAALSKFLNQRSDFLVAYTNSVSESLFPDKVCPLCGRVSENLAQLFLDAEGALKENLGLIAMQLTDIIAKLTEIFDTKIIPKTNVFLSSNQTIISKNNLLSSYLKVSTSELNQRLKKEDISFVNDIESVDFSQFEEKYAEVKSALSARLIEETDVISTELYTKLLRISLEYYSDINPHNEQILFKKKFYISALFSNSINIKLKETEGKYNVLDARIKEITSKYNNVFENITTIVKKYDSAKKQYQSKIATNIAVPMFIFSGKIIQNYPLGLGVIIQVENNAIVFKTGNIKSDIFNNLSTGQLNGVVISLLLAVKETFTTNNSLNTLLIDDPLQTIDEISAISLIDLLSEHFGDTQILLSTHEDDKLFLMKKKYEQSGKKCKVINMQEEYLKE